MEIGRDYEVGLISLQPALRVKVYDEKCGDGIYDLLLRDLAGQTADVVELEHGAVAPFLHSGRPSEQ
jgi:hypothetical protein